LSLTPSIPNSPNTGFARESSGQPSSPNLRLAEESSASQPPDRLMQELQRCEVRLNAWLGQSAANAHWLVRDPVGALRAAQVDMDEQLLAELDATMKMITEKIGEDLCGPGTPNCA
jgi:hypothetical protein